MQGGDDVPIGLSLLIQCGLLLEDHVAIDVEQVEVVDQFTAVRLTFCSIIALLPI